MFKIILTAAALVFTVLPADAVAKPKGCTGYGCAGQPSTANGRPRVKPTKPYVRRNGTYVQGTYRSKPARRR